MEETQEDHQPPSDWGSMHDLAWWRVDDHEPGQESVQLPLPEPIWDHRLKGYHSNTLLCHVMNSFSCKVPSHANTCPVTIWMI